MREILFATTNQAKINQVRGALAPGGVAVKGVNENNHLPEVNENGTSAVENARIKALAYAAALQKVVFSMDNALYLDGLSDELQPGLNVRRIPGHISSRPTDADMLKYYSSLIASLGGTANGHWKFGVCIATPDGKYEEDTIISPRIFVSTPSHEMEPGYPLESIQIDPITNKHIASMTQAEKDLFWQRSIGTPLLNFVLSVNF